MSVKDQSSLLDFARGATHHGRHLICLFMLVSGCVALIGCDADLYSNLQEREANEMMAVLSAWNIDVDKSVQADGKFGLRVDEALSARAITVLENHGLPRMKRKSIEELFPNKMIPTPLEERARYVYSLQQSLEETLTHVDGVITARVHVVVPQNNPFADELAPSSASIFLKVRDDVDLQNQRSDIKRIVGNSIEGLSYKDVTLTMVTSSISTQRQRDGRLAAAEPAFSPGTGDGYQPAIERSSIRIAAMPTIGWVMLVLSGVGGVALTVCGWRRSRVPDSSNESRSSV